MSDAIQVVETLPVKTLSQSDEIRVVFDYYQGKEKKDISIEFKIPVRSVSTIIEKYKLVTNRDILFKKFELDKARESNRIVTIKNKIYDLIENSIKQIADNPPIDAVDKFTKIKDILGKMDEIFRLNNNMATANVDTRTTETKVDVAKVLEQLPTAEDKLRFLQGRIQPQSQSQPQTSKS